MKTKRITMYIEVGLFILGLILSFYFGTKETLSSNIQNLLSNICIGLSTGGLVSFLCAIPAYITQSKGTKDYFYTNSNLLYVQVYQFYHMINDAISKPDVEMQNYFCKHSDEQILKYLSVLISMDSTVFICRTKERQMNLFLQEIYNRVVSPTKSVNQFELIIRKIQLAMSKGQIPNAKITSTTLNQELSDLKCDMQTLLDIIDNTINITYDKKRVVLWKQNTQRVKDTLEGTSLLSED